MPRTMVEKMSLKAKIEAVIYAAEEPVTLAQLAGLFAQELPPANPEQEEEPSVLSLIEEGVLEAESFLADYSMDLGKMALLAEQTSHARPDAIADPAAAEAEAKRLARQRDRQVREQIKAIVDELIEEYSTSNRGMEIREVAGGYRIATKPEYHDAVRAFVKSLKPPMKLSLQALETLAVIAYKQPVTAPEVAEIRSVDSSGVLGNLVSRKLITTAGRKQVIGRPILYKTTREFLLRFGLKDLNELPSIEEFEKLASDIEIGEDEASEGQIEAANLPFEAGATGEAFVEDNVGERESAAGDEGAPSVARASTSAMMESGDLPSEDSSSHPTLPTQEDHVTRS
jgi:segregation and condensation protein B